jgi:hypothetical protein
MPQLRIAIRQVLTATTTKWPGRTGGQVDGKGLQRREFRERLPPAHPQVGAEQPRAVDRGTADGRRGVAGIRRVHGTSSSGSGAGCAGQSAIQVLLSRSERSVAASAPAIVSAAAGDLLRGRRQRRHESHQQHDQAHGADHRARAGVAPLEPGPPSLQRPRVRAQHLLAAVVTVAASTWTPSR